MKLSEKMQDVSEKRKVRSLDKMQSLREEAALGDWSRVRDIAEILRGSSDIQIARYASELVELAKKNMSYANQLGFDYDSGHAEELASGMEIPTDETPAARAESFGAHVLEMAETEKQSPEDVESASSHEIPEMVTPPAAPQDAEVATFKHVVDGHDGQLALYEDASGHFVAVRTSRLA